jgi:hypothetical protein
MAKYVLRRIQTLLSIGESFLAVSPPTFEKPHILLTVFSCSDSKMILCIHP